MRIIAGEFRGRTLKAPKGEGTRPTTDRVREAMMSTVQGRARSAWRRSAAGRAASSSASAGARRCGRSTRT